MVWFLWIGTCVENRSWCNRQQSNSVQRLAIVFDVVWELAVILCNDKLTTCVILEVYAACVHRMIVQWAEGHCLGHLLQDVFMFPSLECLKPKKMKNRREETRRKREENNNTNKKGKGIHHKEILEKIRKRNEIDIIN